MSISSIEKVDGANILYVRGNSPMYVLAELQKIKKPYKVISAYAAGTRHFLVLEIVEKIKKSGG